MFQISWKIFVLNAWELFSSSHTIKFHFSIAPSAFGLAFFHLGNWCSAPVFLSTIMNRPVSDEHLNLIYNHFEPVISFLLY